MLQSYGIKPEDAAKLEPAQLKGVIDFSSKVVNEQVLLPIPLPQEDNVTLGKFNILFIMLTCSKTIWLMQLMIQRNYTLISRKLEKGKRF
jgi:hypothetical protein